MAGVVFFMEFLNGLSYLAADPTNRMKKYQNYKVQANIN